MGSILKLVAIVTQVGGMVTATDIVTQCMAMDMDMDTTIQVIIPDQDSLRSEARRHMTLYLSLIHI